MTDQQLPPERRSAACAGCGRPGRSHGAQVRRGYTLQFGDAPLIACPEAIADDRAWFGRNVARSHRIRSPIGSERDFFKDNPSQLKRFVIVRQVEPGARIRLSARAPQRPLNSEQLGRSLFDQLAADWPLCAKVEALARTGVI